MLLQEQTELLLSLSLIKRTPASMPSSWLSVIEGVWRAEVRKEGRLSGGLEEDPASACRLGPGESGLPRPGHIMSATVFLRRW